MVRARRNVTDIKRRKKQSAIVSDLSVIIPMATPGRRMKYAGPKGIIKLKDKETIIEKQFECIKNTVENFEIVIVGGFEIEKLRNFIRDKLPIRIVQNHIYKDTGMMYSLALGLQATIFSNILILYSDIIFDKELLQQLLRKNISSALVDNNDNIDQNSIGVNINKNEIVNFVYNVNKKWGKAIFLTGLEKDIFEKLAFAKDTNKWFCHEALNHIIGYGGKIYKVEAQKNQLKEINSLKGLR